MSAAAQLHQIATDRQEVIELYRELARDLMLNRIVAFGADPAFAILAHELAELLECDHEYAAMQMWPLTHAVYQAAKGATHE